MKKKFASNYTFNKEKVDEKFAVKFKKPPQDYKGKPGKWFESN